MNVDVIYKAMLIGGNEEYHWDISLFEDFLVIDYVEEGRTPRDSDKFLINAEVAEN